MSMLFDGVDYGRDSQVGIRELQIEWFDQWLMGKDTKLMSMPPAKVFVMGANKWLEDREWPPENAHEQSLYLASDGSLEQQPPATAEEDHYIYDPARPTPTHGGAICCNPKIFPWGPMDQRKVEDRDDLLVYTSKPLKHDVEAVGPVKAVLWVATTAKDTDFTAKLVDVFPDGSARNLTDGSLRLRYRSSLEKAELAKPGTTYKITVDAGVSANVFLKGHRIRLEIASANFPRFDRNANTGGSVADESHWLKAKQTVFHDREHPSRLELMVLPQ